MRKERSVGDGQTLGDRLLAVRRKGFSKVVQSPVTSLPAGLCKVSALSGSSSMEVQLGKSHRAPHAEGLCCRCLKWNSYCFIFDFVEVNSNGTMEGVWGEEVPAVSTHHGSSSLICIFHLTAPEATLPIPNQNLLWMQEEGSGVLRNGNDQGARSLAKYTM